MGLSKFFVTTYICKSLHMNHINCCSLSVEKKTIQLLRLNNSFEKKNHKFTRLKYSFLKNRSLYYCRMHLRQRHHEYVVNLSCGLNISWFTVCHRDHPILVCTLVPGCSSFVPYLVATNIRWWDYFANISINHPLILTMAQIRPVKLGQFHSGWFPCSLCRWYIYICLSVPYCIKTLVHSNNFCPTTKYIHTFYISCNIVYKEVYLQLDNFLDRHNDAINQLTL